MGSKASDRVHFAGILFDLDGTLTDSTNGIVQYWTRLDQFFGSHMYMAKQTGLIDSSFGSELGVDPKVILETAHGRRTIDTLKIFCPERANWESEI
jgi:glycerol-1-phosphatase